MKGPSGCTGIYFGHYQCFGHTSRVMAVAEVYKKRFPNGNLFFIQAGVAQPLARIDQLADVYPLPGVLMDRRNFREPVKATGQGADERGMACEQIITREKPDLMMTELFPLGREECRFELIPSLIKATAQGAAIWAIAGYPLLTDINSNWREKILKLYQKIIIFSPSMEKEFIGGFITREADRQRYLDFFQSHEKKIVFAGYLLPQQEVVKDDEDPNIPKPHIPQGACRVSVVRGGGAYMPKIIAQAIRASDLLGKEYYLTVVAGPSTSPEEWYFFNTLVAKKKIRNLVLLRAVGDYEGLIKNSDVCISVAAYHSSVMLMKYRKKAVIIPFDGNGEVSMREQPARAALLKEKIGAIVISIEKLTAETLTTAVKEAAAFKGNIPVLPTEWFMGADVFDRELKGLFGQ